MTDTDNTLTTDPARVLRDAADYLSMFGWIQGELFTGSAVNPPACAVGAIQIAVAGRAMSSFFDSDSDDFDADDVGAVLTAVDVLADYLVCQGVTEDSLGCAGVVPQWNDTFGRTVTEVCRALRRAADVYEHDQGEVRS